MDTLNLKLHAEITRGLVAARDEDEVDRGAAASFAAPATPAATGAGEIAIGTVVGSNITNITLVLGIGTVLCGNIPVSGILIKRDGIVLIVAELLFLVLCLAGLTNEWNLSRADGIILLIVFIGYFSFLLKGGRTSDEKEGEQNGNKKFRNQWSAVIFFVIGLMMVFGGAKLMVDSVVAIAESFRLPEGLIAATVVSFGTSVPELAVTVTGVIKKQHGIALGNILGSCTFNIVLVLGASAVICPLAVSQEMLFLSVGMLAVGIILLVAMSTGRTLTRKEGIVFLSLYLLFIVYNIIKM